MIVHPMAAIPVIKDPDFLLLQINQYSAEQPVQFLYEVAAKLLVQTKNVIGIVLSAFRKLFTAKHYTDVPPLVPTHLGPIGLRRCHPPPPETHRMRGVNAFG